MKKITPDHIIVLVFVFIIILIIIAWFFPSSSLLTDKYTIAHYRSNLKDLLLVVYIPLTLWLVWITRKMSEIALNAQKASNRPELECTLLISNEKPDAKTFKAQNLEILNTKDAQYTENKGGACVFLLIQNLPGSGKAINLSLKMKFEATNPEKFGFDRNFQYNFLSPGDSLACYIYRFEWPGLPTLGLKLDYCKISYTTPFDEASKEPLKEINFDSNYELPAEGNKVGEIKLSGGIIAKIGSKVEKNIQTQSSD